jgi:hypothetical protein
MDWGDFLNQEAQGYISRAAAPKQTPAVATNPATGTSYTEGKPASAGVGGLLSNPLVLIGGVAAIGLVVWLAARK